MHLDDAMRIFKESNGADARFELEPTCGNDVRFANQYKTTLYNRAWQVACDVGPSITKTKALMKDLEKQLVAAKFAMGNTGIFRKAVEEMKKVQSALDSLTRALDEDCDKIMDGAAEAMDE